MYLRCRNEWICSERPITILRETNYYIADLASACGHEGTRANLSEGSRIIAGTSSRLIYWLDLWVSPPYSSTLTSGIVGNFSLFDNK